MSKPALDLAQYVQRREILAYEQHLARQAYAYGVDLRRSAWLDHSTLGEPMMRAVDRRWNGLTDDLCASVLQPANRAPPTEVMEELVRLLKLLRAPLPSLRLLRPGVSADDWPILAPLGTTKGGSHWLVIDLERLMALPAVQRTFLLGANLGNLHCDHGPIFAAHLLTHRRGSGHGFVKTVLRPWSRVSVFSADRAGLLAVGELAPALEALRAHADPGVSWYPDLPAAATRVQALEDFDHSRVMTRLRLTYKDGESWMISPKIQQLYAQQQRAQAAKDEPEPEPAPEPEPDPEPSVEDSPGETEPEDPIDEELLEKVRVVEEALLKSWSLARCDSRLTRRLGLL